MLDLKFLGPPELSYEGYVVKFATRKALALFVYLVVEGGLHPRAKLMTLFWPESQPHLAQPALRNTLARIKEALREVGDALQTQADRIGCNTDLAHSLDLRLVTQAIAETQPTIPATHALLQRAVEASRGPFLDGFSLPDAPEFDEWLRNQRMIWEHRQILIYDRLSLYQLETHQIQSALETVIRWLHVDPLSESAYRRLMRLHFLNGDRSAAIDAYESCRTLLGQELAVVPSAETEQILAHVRSSPPMPLVSTIPGEAGSPLRIPFAGRGPQYQELIQAFRLVKGGSPQVVVMSGESGIGKTRLAGEFLKWADLEGADVLHGRAFETSGQLSYQPMIDALRERLDRENALDDLLDDVWLIELSRILPEVRGRYPDLPLATGNDATARVRLFEAIARLTQALATRRPLVWLIDDLQWADAESLELLQYLARHWQSKQTPVLLFMLARQ